jgi:hypothetical protein
MGEKNADLSIYGIRAPGALSLRPFLKIIMQAARSRNRFLYGSQRLCKASTLSPLLWPLGLAGLLISRSPTSGGGLEGVESDASLRAVRILCNSIDSSR